MLVAVSIAGLSGACANTGQQILEFATTKPGQSVTPTPVAAGGSELDRATAYWKERYKKDPRDVKAAISFAQNLKASGNKRGAYAVLQQASVLHGDNKELASEYGRLALEFGQLELAGKLLDSAYDPARPDWKLLSARGAVLGKLGRFQEAIGQFERARSLAPNQPSLTNNLAMAYVAAGQLSKAETLLRTIALAPNATPRMRQNLSLVLGLQGRYTEAKALAAADGADAEAYARIDRLKKMTQARGTTKPGKRHYTGATAALRR
ncbi:MAG: tetratricopeptide repeat protein [Pseudomonadota bacterium]